ncbi:MAG: lysophospholipid acyltransferase family protein, partial [Acidobacteriota bacterium]
MITRILYWPALLARTAVVLAATLGGYALLVVAALLSKISPARGLAFRNVAFRFWSRTLLRAFRVRATVEGDPPPPGSMLIANHVSYVDIPLIGQAFDAAFVAKADISGWPLLGTIFAAAQTVYIDRGRKRDLVRVMAEMDRYRRRGLGLLVF